MSDWEREQQRALPAWLNDDHGRAFEASFGAAKDTSLALLEQAVNSRFPYVGRPDALALQAASRLILRAPPEEVPPDGDSLFADRLRRAHDIWKWGGTKDGIRAIFEPYGFDATTCVVVKNYEVILDGEPAWYSRGIVLCGPVHWEPDTTWDDPADVTDWSDETIETWDSTATTRDLDYLRASIRNFKSDDAYPVLVGVQLVGVPGDGFWDGPTPGTYDEPGAVWSDAVDDVIYWSIGRVWGDEVWTGQDQDWWCDGFVAPTTGWSLVP